MKYDPTVSATHSIAEGKKNRGQIPSNLQRQSVAIFEGKSCRIWRYKKT